MGFFSKLGSKIENIFGGSSRIDDDLLEELEETLILSDVGAYAAQEICSKLKDRAKDENVSDSKGLKKLLAEIITDILGEEEPLSISTKPSIILMVGVNGVGKTTTIGKLAARLTGEGKKVLLAAADTFRAAAAEQLEIWAERTNCQMIRHQEGSDPAAVVFDAISAAKARNVDVVICDTAGRLHNKKNLMDELSKISRVIDRELPDADKEVLLVLDAVTGQNAINQAQQFKEAAGLTGIVLTKLDGTAKGGMVIGIRKQLGIPVKFIGVGEGIEDLQQFDPKAFAEALFFEEKDRT